VPGCVQTCVGRARVFGDINDPNSEVRRLVDTYSTIVLKPGVGTKPQVYYILANRSGLEPVKVFKTLSAQQKQDLKEHHEHFEHYVGR
jgi:Fe-S-cluster-containing dehydrogenase component